MVWGYGSGMEDLAEGFGLADRGHHALGAHLPITRGAPVHLFRNKSEKIFRNFETHYSHDKYCFVASGKGS